MKIKWTWKSVVAVCAMVAGALTASEGVVPGSAATGLAVAGGIILAVERYAEAQDNAVANGTTVPPTVTTGAPATRIVNVEGKAYYEAPDGSLKPLTAPGTAG